MYFPDLSPYTYAPRGCDPPALNIGWLDRAHEFTRSTVPTGFMERLRRLMLTRVKQMRGFQTCQFCTGEDLDAALGTGPLSEDERRALRQACHEDGRFSSAEIRVTGQDGRIYASPMMIAHYVEAHGYLPPPEFVEAVMQTMFLTPRRMILHRVREHGRVRCLSPEAIDPRNYPASFVIDEIERDIPVVFGVIQLWDGSGGEKHPHLHYICPRCGTEQNVDLHPDDANPRFGSCDSCLWRSPVLIQWRQDQ
ncbi:hypothetical protein [Haloferula sp. BvORR071]|uniref:DUF7919 family protein n=1 Tax=Haloferula sp. BvORR071 TaxID=1396141 RepID=UPI000550436F|nr:hypothetical protein [Haloferula sp. BvORR071]